VQSNNEKKVVDLKLNDVLPNRFQPRIKFDEESINELAESIKKYGVIQPIVVRQVGEKYEIIAGERRYKASVIAGKETIPAIIYDLNDNESVEIALLENVQREDLTPIEKAISYKKILDMGYINQEDLAQKIGKSQSSIANTLRLLNLAEEVQEALLNTKISERHARSLLKIKDENKQVEMLNRIINERLTVRRTDEEIKKMDNNTIIPDITLPEDNYDLPGFMNIDKIEQEAQDIIKEEKPVADIDALLKPPSINVVNSVESTDNDESNSGIQSGKFFNLFEEDNSSVGPTMPEFNFDMPSVETPAQPTMPEFNFDMPSVETPAQSAMPEFNFDMPSVETPAQPTMPEFNFDMPSVETPAQPTMPEFNFDTPSVETPAQPTMPEFNFDIPSVETPAQPTMPEFNFDMPSVETPAQSAMPEFNFDMPSVETPEQSAIPEFNFDMPSVETPAQPTMPEFNFDMPSVETPAQPTMPEFNFDVPSVETPEQSAMPEFNFDMPSVETPAQPTMPEFNFDIPTLETASDSQEGTESSGLNLFGVSNSENNGLSNLNGEIATVESNSAMPEFNFELPIDTNNSIANVETEFPSLETTPEQPAMPEFSFDMPSVEMPTQPELVFDSVNITQNNIETKNIRLAIDTIRNCEENLQKMGFVVDVIESDLDNKYQVIININK